MSENENRMKVIMITMLSCIALTGWVVNAPAAGSAQSLGGLTLTEVRPRIVTPNGDNKNDVVLFRFDNTLVGIPIESSIYDVSGTKIAGLRHHDTINALTWDGRDDGGRSVPSGIYIYSIAIGKNRATGTVVVAR